jgi:hypothetical protein
VLLLFPGQTFGDTEVGYSPASGKIYLRVGEMFGWPCLPTADADGPPAGAAGWDLQDLSGPSARGLVVAIKEASFFGVRGRSSWALWPTAQNGQAEWNWM